MIVTVEGKKYWIFLLAGLLVVAVLEITPYGVGEYRVHEVGETIEQLVVLHSYFKMSNIMAFLCMVGTMFAILMNIGLLVSKNHESILKNMLFIGEILAIAMGICVFINVPTIIAGCVVVLLLGCCIFSIMIAKKKIQN